MGEGVEQNDVEAGGWFFKAAKQGDSAALKQLFSLAAGMKLADPGKQGAFAEAVGWSPSRPTHDAESAAAPETSQPS